MKVGYLGNRGTFSEMAVHKTFNKVDYQAVGYADFDSLLDALESKEIHYCLLPVENSQTGMIFRTYDLLKDRNIYACKEVYVRIDEHLIGLKGTDIKLIQEVYTHPEPIAQCQGFFKNHPWIKPIPYYDTASSVQLVKETNDSTKAAIASKLSAELYGLEILAEKIQDHPDNITRFFCLSKEENIDQDANCTSLYFTVKHESKALFKVIEIFAKYDINMLKLQSRPINGRIFEYCFYLDIEANVVDTLMKQMIQEIKQHCIQFKILGCYTKQSVEEML